MTAQQLPFYFQTLLPFMPVRPDKSMVLGLLKKIDYCTSVEELETCAVELEAEEKKYKYHHAVDPFPSHIWPRWEKQREKVDPDSFYSCLVTTSDTETVNGFDLFNVVDNWMTRRMFDECERVARDDIPFYSFREFFKAYDSLACSDWSKKTQEGESYKGFYNAQSDSALKTNAYKLTRLSNALRLWHLPFPKSLLLHTIKISCATRRESVCFSNFICVWLKRKRAAMNAYDQNEKK
jgi:hypothetical protein